MAGVLEVVASTITLAGIFGSCIQAFEAFYIAKERKSDLRTLFLQFKLQEARLWSWGNALGWHVCAKKSGPTSNFLMQCNASLSTTINY